MHSPFNSLAAAENASSPGDTIVIEPSPLNVPPLDGGIALKADQRLVGDGPPVVQLGKPLLQGGPPLVRSTELPSQPRIANTSALTNNGDAVELADGADVENIVIATAYRGGIYGKDVVDVTVRGNDVSNFNTSGTVGFRVQPFYLNSYTPGLARGGPPPFGNGIGAGWAAILIDTATVTTSLSINENFVHDGVCGDGIDLRSMGTGNATAQVNRNFVTSLTQCSGTGVGTIEGIGTQVTGTGVLHASVDQNTEANTGSPRANMDSLFVNSAESGTLIQTISHNLYTSGIGGASTNGMEYIISNGNPYSQLTISDSNFYNNPGRYARAIQSERSRVSGSKYYNLWFNEVTPLTQLQVRVQDTDLSSSLSGVAVAFDQTTDGRDGELRDRSWRRSARQQGSKLHFRGRHLRFGDHWIRRLCRAQLVGFAIRSGSRQDTCVRRRKC